MAKQFRGVEKSQEVQSKTLWRNTKPYSVRFSDWIEKPEGFLVMSMSILGVGVVAPQFILFSFVASILLSWFAYSRKFSLPFRMPANANLPDFNDLKAGGSDPAIGKGIAFLGNEINSRKELWFKNDDMRTHLLIFGSTGAGKALALDESILTRRGWVENKHITILDKVMSPTGLWLDVEGVFPQGKVEFGLLNLADGRRAKSSFDHLWTVNINKSQSSFVEDIIGRRNCKDYFEGKKFDSLTITTLQIHKLRSCGIQVYLPTIFSPISSQSGSAELSFYPDHAVSMHLTDLKLVYTAHCNDLDSAKRDSRIATIWTLGFTQRLYLLESFLSTFVPAEPEKKLGLVDVSSAPLKICDLERITSWESQLLRDLAFSVGLSISHDKNSVFLDVGYRGLGVEISKVDHAGFFEAQCIKVSDPSGLFVMNDWVVTHNTETLISIAFNALIHASGFIYVDGKGDSALFAKIFAMARAMGRDDDLLVINYMTGSRDVFGPQTTKLSNTLNPFTSGSSGGLTELLVSLMDDSGGDNAMWKGRAISLIGSIMMALVHMRDEKEILLDVDEIREYLILENIIKLSKRRDLPGHVITAIKAYLKSLPGYVENAPKQSETVNDQHGYLQMQFTKILGSLADSYGYIFRTNLGEVDFWDVVANRRILLVLLPALEKSPEELANLGKIVVACLKQMMATGLGSLLEGEYRKIIETKPTYAPTPFLCILDEYGYYAVKGAAVMPAQARSLGFSMIFAGQDYPAFEKASKEEAMSTVANCNIKIFMKLEDPKDTFDLFAKLVGEAYVTHVSGFQANPSALVTNYNDMQNANVEKRARGDLLDLKDQREGEAHIIFKSSVIRAEMFYAAPRMPKRLQLNYFLKIEPPDRSEVLEMESGMEDLKKNLLRPAFMEDLAYSTDPVPDITLAQKVFKSHTHLDMVERACAAVFAHYETVQQQMDAFKTSMGLFMTEDDEDDDSISVFNAPDDDQFEKAKKKGKVPLDEDDEDFEHPDGDADFPVFMNSERTQEGLSKIEQMGGASEADADESAQKIAEDMRAISQYPQSDVPEDKAPDDILDMLKELDEKMDELEQDDE